MIPREKREAIYNEALQGLKDKGFEPDAEFLEMGRKFVEGEIGTEDMMDWVMASVRKALIDSIDCPPLPRDLH